MKVLLIAAALTVGTASTCLAQPQTTEAAIFGGPTLAARIAAMPKDLKRAGGPELSYALQLAQAAAQACKAKGGGVSVLVTDSAGVPVVLLADDSSSERSQLINQTKANTVIRYRMPSGDVKRNARNDPRLASEVALDQNIGEPRLGAFPLMADSELIGVLSVSGLSDGGNEDCARAAIARTPQRLVR